VAKEPFYCRLFRALLRLFPAEFRGDFGEQMAADFDDQRREVAAQPRETRRLWFRTVLDLAARAPREHLDVLWRDVVHALRHLRRRPVSAAAAVLSLAIGVGLNAAIFSVVYGVQWRELPLADGDRLVQIGSVRPGGGTVGDMPPELYDNLSARLPSLEALAVAELVFAPLTLVEPAEPRSLFCTAVTPAFLEILGVTPMLGRDFTGEEYAQSLAHRSRATGADRYTVPRATLLGHTEWQRQFGGDADAVGRLVRVRGGDRVEIVGVMGPEVESLAGIVPTDCWIPQDRPENAGDVDPWDDSNLVAFGRLAPHASVDHVRIELEALQAASGSEPGPYALGALTLRDQLVGPARLLLSLVFGAVVCVLLVTSANVANLLLGWTAGRRDELATRVALGATRVRLVRQSLTESLVVAVAGGAAGVLLAVWATPALVAWAPTDIPRLEGVSVGWRTIAFAALVSAGVGVCCGVVAAVPLLRRTRTAVQSGIGRVTTRVGRLRQGLAVAEISLALILLVGATLMVRSVRALGAIDLGFDPSGVVSVGLPGRWGLDDRLEPRKTYLEIVEAVKTLPGVQAAGVGLGPLTVGAGMAWGGPTITDDGRTLTVRIRVDDVSPGYFEALGVRLLAGRFLDERDTIEQGAPPILVNATAARTFWGDRDPIGRSLTFGTSGSEQIVVGVIDDLREASLVAEPGPTLYQVSARESMFLSTLMLVRTDRNPEALIPSIRSIVRSIDPYAPPATVTPLQDYIDRETAPRRFVLQTVGLFSLLGLGLAVMGVYGVLAAFVTQRVPEIGVRMAFGATSSNVVRFVLHQGWRLAAIGVPLGLAGAVALNGTMRAQVYGVSTLDPATYVVAALCLLLATVAACLIPARRAARRDPVAALRAE